MPWQCRFTNRKLLIFQDSCVPSVVIQVLMLGGSKNAILCQFCLMFLQYRRWKTSYTTCYIRKPKLILEWEILYRHWLYSQIASINKWLVMEWPFIHWRGLCIISHLTATMPWRNEWKHPTWQGANIFKHVHSPTLSHKSIMELVNRSLEEEMCFFPACWHVFFVGLKHQASPSHMNRGKHWSLVIRKKHIGNSRHGCNGYYAGV